MFPGLFALRSNITDIAKFKECLKKTWVALTQDEICMLIESTAAKSR